jgi:hypothetical protein
MDAQGSRAARRGVIHRSGGERLGVTRERIRQIQEEALEKMCVKIAEHETPAVETAVMAA